MSKSAMLRTRRRDVNVKPNRRLDRKSSRGMIYENEELRLKTININAEIERGQSDIKKLRRENEQLRKEIWCLRDEYEKLDKLLKEKDDETGSSCSSDTDSCTSCSDSEENEQSQNMENVQKTTLNNLRTEFDHLSVVTEETSAENSDKNSSSAVSPKETWNIIAPDQGYPNCGTLSSSRSTLPIDQMPKHFFAPLKTSKSYENCTETEALGLSSWSLGSTANWSPFPNTNFINFDQSPLVKPLGNSIFPQKQSGVVENGHDHKRLTSQSPSGFVPNLEQPLGLSHNLEACKKTSTDILVKTDTFPHFSKDSSTNSFINGGNLEELLQDIETISQDILQISSQEGKAQTIGNFPENLVENGPYKSEINVVLMPKAMPLIGFDKYQNLKSSVESLDAKSFENFNLEDTELDTPGPKTHSANDQLTLTRNVPNLIDNSLLSRSNTNEQISRNVQTPNANLILSRNISNENLLTSRNPNESISKSRIISNPNELTSRQIPNINANISKFLQNQNETSRSIQNLNEILTLPKTAPINPRTLLNSNDISKNESLLLSRVLPNPNESKQISQTIPTETPRPRTPKFPTQVPNSDPSPNDQQIPNLQRQPSNPFFYGTFGSYSDQFSNRYNPETFAHDNFGFKNEVLQQSSSKLDETDQEKLNLKTNLDNETVEKNSSQVKDGKTEVVDDKSSKKEEQKSPKNRRTRKVSIYFKGKKDKLARSLSLDTKISQKNLENLDKSQKIETPKTPVDSTFGSQKLDPKVDLKIHESDTKTSSDSKTSIDRKHRKSSSTSPERKHIHVKLEDDKSKKGHRKRHRKSDKRPNRTNSIDRGGRERSYSVCTDRSNILDHKFGHFDEYTNSERDRSNSLSSCDTVKSRKMSAVPQFQVSGKIPWFGCWGNGCL